MGSGSNDTSVAQPAVAPRLPVRFGRSFGRAWTATLLLAAVAFPLFTLGFVSRWDDSQLRWVNRLYARKTIVAARRQDAGRTGAGRPRLVLVGGSGTLYGIDAELIERKTGVPTVNFGTHAGLGLRYLLTRARRELRPGDRVLLAPEYELLADDGGGHFEPMARGFVLTFDKRYLAETDPADAVRILYTVPLGEYADSVPDWWRRWHSP